MNKEYFRQSQKRYLKHRCSCSLKQNFTVFKSIEKILKHKKISNILLYIPQKYEIDLLRYRHNLSKKYKLFVPFMQDESLKMVKLRLPFSKKEFGILEPEDSLKNIKIDLAVIPVIGVDKNFRRIGHGKGFYDRFFEKLTYKPLVIFVQSIAGLSDEILTQSYDVQADFYINPYKKYHKRETKNVNNNYINRIYSRYHRRWGRVSSCKKNK